MGAEMETDRFELTSLLRADLVERQQALKAVPAIARRLWSSRAEPLLPQPRPAEATTSFSLAGSPAACKRERTVMPLPRRAPSALAGTIDVDVSVLGMRRCVRTGNQQRAAVGRRR